MTDHIHEQALLVTMKSYDFFLLSYRHNQKLPKSARYSLGVRCEGSILELINELSLASRQPKVFKEPHLIKAGAIVDTIKFINRIIHELGYIELKHYLKLMDKLDEISRMIGGWIKYIRNQS